jgi:hypothetical protein
MGKQAAIELDYDLASRRIATRLANKKHAGPKKQQEKLRCM